MTRQQQLCNNKWFRLAVSVILTFAVLLVFVFSPFAEAHAVGVLGTELIDIIIAGLSACGITFTTTGGFGSLEDYVSNLIDEYAVDQSTTPLGLFGGAQYGNNKLGQLLLNNRFVREISAFATWIKVTFGLVNNSEYTLQQAGITLDSLTVYTTPFQVVDSRNSTTITYRVTITNSSDTVYVTCYRTNDTGSIRTFLFSTGPFEVKEDTIQNGNVIGSSATTQSAYIAQYGEYPYIKDASTTFSKSLNSDIVYVTSKSLITDALEGTSSVEENGVGIGISTGVLNPPLDDTDYEDGDGALVDVGSTWGATLKDILDKIRLNWQNVQSGNQDISMDYAPEKEVGEQLPEQTDIENLPGGTAWNPTDQQLKFFEFESIWHYVAQWISDFTAGASVVWNATVQLPSPVVNMVYAMVTLAIIFGVIKVMRA